MLKKIHLFLFCFLFFSKIQAQNQVEWHLSGLEYSDSTVSAFLKCKISSDIMLRIMNFSRTSQYPMSLDILNIENPNIQTYSFKNKTYRIGAFSVVKDSASFKIIIKSKEIKNTQSLKATLTYYTIDKKRNFYKNQYCLCFEKKTKMKIKKISVGTCSCGNYLLENQPVSRD